MRYRVIPYLSSRWAVQSSVWFLPVWLTEIDWIGIDTLERSSFGTEAEAIAYIQKIITRREEWKRADKYARKRRQTIPPKPVTKETPNG